MAKCVSFKNFISIIFWLVWLGYRYVYRFKFQFSIFNHMKLEKTNTRKPINLNYLQTQQIIEVVTSVSHLCASSRGRQGRDPIGPNSPAHFRLRANDRAGRVCVISVLFNINCGQDYFTFIPSPIPNATFSSVKLVWFANMQHVKESDFSYRTIELCCLPELRRRNINNRLIKAWDCIALETRPVAACTRRLLKVLGRYLNGVICAFWSSSSYFSSFLISM